MLAGTSLSAAAKAAAWIVLIGIGVAGGEAAPRPWELAAVAIAAPVALFAFVGTVLSIWRGPPVVEFAPEDGVRCGEQESEPVRAYAQLRGTIGGAGHVHPARLAFPAISWAAAIVAGVYGISPALAEVSPTPVVLAVAAAVGAWVFPSRPYWYREVMGGGALVTPPEAVRELAAREMQEDAPGIAAVHETGRAVPILREHAAHAERAPRYPLERRLLIERGGSAVEVATLNVSAGGLAVRWPGDLPGVGDDVVLRIEDRPFTRGVDAVVCWSHPSASPERTVGIRLRAEGAAARAWRELVETVARAAGRIA